MRRTCCKVGAGSGADGCYPNVAGLSNVKVASSCILTSILLCGFQCSLFVKLWITTTAAFMLVRLCSMFLIWLLDLSGSHRSGLPDDRPLFVRPKDPRALRRESLDHVEFDASCQQALSRLYPLHQSCSAASQLTVCQVRALCRNKRKHSNDKWATGWSQSGTMQTAERDCI